MIAPININNEWNFSYWGGQDSFTVQTIYPEIVNDLKHINGIYVYGRGVNHYMYIFKFKNLKTNYNTLGRRLDKKVSKILNQKVVPKTS